jgi:DMSO/TMAO reductase YedYZ molybdopterin-dependent catalytic subunit
VVVRAGLAGIVAVAVALAVAEVLAGLLPGMPSLVGVVAQQVVPATPGDVAAWAISTLGTANKVALEVGTAVVALLVGAALGVGARRRLAPVVVVFVGFGALGVLAALPEAGSQPAVVVVGTLVAVVAGLASLHRLLARLPAPGHVEPGARGRPTDPPVSRRGFLSLAAGLGAAAVVGAAGGRLALASGRNPVDPSMIALPPPARALPALTAEQEFGLEGLSPVLTPNDAFYRIDTALRVPQVDPDGWTLRIHGLVDREVVLTYDDLLQERLEEYDVTLSCVSNEVGGDLVGNARWLGVRLADLLARAGVRAEAGQVVGRSVDGWTGGFPIEAVEDGRDAIVAVGMNGEPLPTRHGFPARLVVPGLYGYVSATKWLEEIELTTWEGFDGYWVPRGWSKRGPIKIQSRIDVPRGDAGPVDAGEVVVAGVAWAPVRGIAAVEVDVDDRDDWREAELSEALSDDAWVQWRTTVDLEPGEHVLRVRASDAAGGTQPPGPVPPRPDGAEGWHAVRIEVS